MGRVVLQWNKLHDLIEKRRSLGPVVFTNGCFDILHVGHVRYLRDAAALGKTLVVGLNTDASVKRLKGPTRPVQVESDRAEILSQLGCVDFVTLFDEETPLKLIQTLSPSVLVKGGDWPVDKIIGADFVQKTGGKVLSLPFHPGRSTSEILKRI